MFTLDKLNGLKRYNTNGYYQYYIPEHHLANKAGLVYEHQIMAEEKLGRELKPEEVVHHDDRNRHNNSLDNLMVFKTSADHAAYHMGRDIVLEGDVYVAIGTYEYKKYKSKRGNISIKDECPYCGKLKDYQAKMCLDCYKKEQAKNIPPKEELREHLKDKSMCAIGRVYNVSDNAVRKWCKKYGLPVNKKDIEKFREDEFGIIKKKKIKHEPTLKKPVVMLDTRYKLLNKFESVYTAAVYLGDKSKRKHISQACNDKRKSAYGYKWMWLEDYEKYQQYLQTIDRKEL